MLKKRRFQFNTGTIKNKGKQILNKLSRSRTVGVLKEILYARRYGELTFVRLRQIKKATNTRIKLSEILNNDFTIKKPCGRPAVEMKCVKKNK